ncbi:hypothetical protein [Aquisalibacillus elongatus]|uniref:Lipoprotein n=1 Tax=Aquisalibacillus elongatus TaxID=485577 RepID=A0A3N5AZG0_9BACI|nr:hypothetical protein [Aquisalibacillus elongatus]RPF50387.1 hypothetical protein EDC24_2825 [Aquisalibacillus elongatus]
MKQIISIFLVFTILILSGCTDESTEEQQNELKELKGKIAELENTVDEQQKIINHDDREFSYLEGLTEAESEAYQRFVEDKGTQHLSDMSPEKIVLVYLHSVVKGDVEAIYSLTYDDGTLSDLVTFRQDYYNGGLHKKEIETTLDFRYYDSIKVRDENKTENQVAVEMSVDFGLYHHSVIYGLKKENEIWKMELNQL